MKQYIDAKAMGLNFLKTPCIKKQALLMPTVSTDNYDSELMLNERGAQCYYLPLQKVYIEIVSKPIFI